MRPQGIPRGATTGHVRAHEDHYDVAAGIAAGKREESRLTGNRLMADGKKIPVIVCSCGKRLNAATELFRQAIRPKLGDVTICGDCGKPYRFARGGLQGLSQDEVRALPVGLAAQVTNAQRKVLRGCKVKGEA